jgi:amino acid adenylation domain-containing protein
MENPSAEPIHVAVERLARQQPEHVAVVDEHGAPVTYRQLDSTAESWSVRLAQLGVAPGSFVPVLMSRSARLTAAVLAILKCGAAYAALDRRWPAERIDATLAQLTARTLVTDAPGPFSVPTWRAPGLDEPLADLPRRPPVEVDPAAPACVFFTSGTTGEPKGVVSTHGAIRRLFPGSGPMAFGPACVMPQTVAVNWDMWSFEQWSMLTTGGTSVAVTDDYVTPHLVADLIARRGIDTLWLTTSVFNLCVDEDVDSFAGLRRLFVGGERLSPGHVRAFLGRFRDIDLYNGYGPAECCMLATTHPITLADCDGPYGIPIGRPVPGTQVYVVDGDRLCPPGVPGELCLAGAGLALGYLADDELTQAKFTALAVDGRPVRVYRTGDWGLRDDSGLLHFIGRTDRQIKLRGQRVELEGVEAQTEAIPDVLNCVAAAVAGELGGYERLVLYYTVRPGSVPRATGRDPLRVRDELARRLPPYAVPDLIVAVDRLPLTLNGKVDHAALNTMHPDFTGQSPASSIAC